MIDAEIAPMIEALKKDHADVFRDMAIKGAPPLRRRSAHDAGGGFWPWPDRPEERLDKSFVARMAQDAETKTKAMIEAQSLLSGIGASQDEKRNGCSDEV